jgi:hypothetical protein
MCCALSIIQSLSAVYPPSPVHDELVTVIGADKFVKQIPLAEKVIQHSTRRQQVQVVVVELSELENHAQIP